MWTVEFAFCFTMSAKGAYELTIERTALDSIVFIVTDEDRVANHNNTTRVIEITIPLAFLAPATHKFPLYFTEQSHPLCLGLGMFALN